MSRRAIVGTGPLVRLLLDASPDGWAVSSQPDGGPWLWRHGDPRTGEGLRAALTDADVIIALDTDAAEGLQLYLHQDHRERPIVWNGASGALPPQAVAIEVPWVAHPCQFPAIQDAVAHGTPLALPDGEASLADPQRVVAAIHAGLAGRTPEPIPVGSVPWSAIGARVATHGGAPLITRTRWWPGAVQQPQAPAVTSGLRERAETLLALIGPPTN